MKSAGMNLEVEGHELGHALSRQVAAHQRVEIIALPVSSCRRRGEYGGLRLRQGVRTALSRPASNFSGALSRCARNCQRTQLLDGIPTGLRLGGTIPRHPLRYPFLAQRIVRSASVIVSELCAATLAYAERCVAKTVVCRFSKSVIATNGTFVHDGCLTARGSIRDW